MSDEQLLHLSNWLINFMQASTLLPMAVVWWRRAHFSAPIRRLSWYVYLSVACSLGSHLYPYLLPNNYGFIIAFNTSKIALFGAVYYLVVTSEQMRRLIMLGSVAALVAVGFVISYDLQLAIAVGRVGQCALLAAFALIYMEQTLGRPEVDAEPGFTSRSPMWLLSVGQLLYSAGTVTAFSLDYLSLTAYDQTSKLFFIIAAGLVFNAFLTLAFLRDRRSDYTTGTVRISPSGQLVTSEPSPAGPAW
ncbi:MAG: hypothetical protein JWR44_1598 [Hymenobacter sp.]|nr:hypothetical protein [Hymenobacter sp.]